LFPSSLLLLSSSPLPSLLLVDCWLLSVPPPLLLPLVSSLPMRWQHDGSAMARILAVAADVRRCCAASTLPTRCLPLLPLPPLLPPPPPRCWQAAVAAIVAAAAAVLLPSPRYCHRRHRAARHRRPAAALPAAAALLRRCCQRAATAIAGCDCHRQHKKPCHHQSTPLPLPSPSPSPSPPPPPLPLPPPLPAVTAITNATPIVLATATAKTALALAPALVNVTILNHQLNHILNNPSLII
jgi:hypothetical protein